MIIKWYLLCVFVCVWIGNTESSNIHNITAGLRTQSGSVESFLSHIVQIAVLLYIVHVVHVICLSVCLSVCDIVTFPVITVVLSPSFLHWLKVKRLKLIYILPLTGKPSTQLNSSLLDQKRFTIQTGVLTSTSSSSRWRSASSGGPLPE